MQCSQGFLLVLIDIVAKLLELVCYFKIDIKKAKSKNQKIIFWTRFI